MRKTGVTREQTWAAIREAAIELIATHGFEGFNLRELASRVGIKAGSLYNHVASKEDLLRVLLENVMRDLLEEFEEQVEILDDPHAQMRAAIRLHVLFHTRRRMEVLIGNTELRSLSPENYQLIVGLRDRYSNKLRKIVSNGVTRGVFHVPDVKVTTFAIIAMLTGVGYWYRANGSMSQQRLIELHERLVMQTLGIAGVTTADALAVAEVQ